MTPGAIITQIILSITNLGLIGVGIYIAIDGTYPTGAHVSTWGALAGLGALQSLLVWRNLR